MNRRHLLSLLGAGLLALWTSLAPVQAQSPASDPLPSWSDTAPKRAIVDFVARVTREGGPDFVAVEDRIATFDNDGTLWAEQPVYFQVAFALDEVKRLAPRFPEWKDKEPFRSVIAGDLRALMTAGEKDLLEIMSVTHSGMTTAEFMKAFYGRVLGNQHQTPAAALRAAQLELMRSSRWHDPYYWAGFVFFAEWN